MQFSVPAADTALEQLVAQLRQGPVMALSGAGLSTASGIPAYRDEQGAWKHSSPVMHQEFLKSAARRQRYWARSFIGWPTVGGATPNAGHRALAALQAAGAVGTIVTQNVDGLHQKAGSADVIELHGGIDGVRCLACGLRHSRAAMQDWLEAANPGFVARAADSQRAPDGDAHVADAHYAEFQVPDCPACAGLLKPDVVFFGDSVPRERVRQATDALSAATALLVVGSSLMVYSGFRFAEQARREGKPILAINRGVTRADALLTLKIEADCAEVLTQALTAL